MTYSLPPKDICRNDIIRFDAEVEPGNGPIRRGPVTIKAHPSHPFYILHRHVHSARRGSQFHDSEQFVTSESAIAGLYLPDFFRHLVLVRSLKRRALQPRIHCRQYPEFLVRIKSPRHDIRHPGIIRVTNRDQSQNDSKNLDKTHHKNTLSSKHTSRALKRVPPIHATSSKISCAMKQCFPSYKITC